MPLALRSPRLRRIIVAYSVNRLGTWFGLLALVLAVFDHTHGAESGSALASVAGSSSGGTAALAVAGLLFAGQALPALVVPAVVARVEASERQHELSALYVFEAIVTTALAVIVWHYFWLPAILFLVALDGTAALAASALLRSEVARAARTAVELGELRFDDGLSETERFDEAERRANAALNVAFSTTFVLGPAIGGAIVATAGAPAALFVDVGSFALGALLLTDLHPHVDNAGGDSVRARLRAAAEHVRAVPLLRRLFIAEALGLLFIESGAPIEVTFVKQTLGSGDRGVGLLLTMWGAGAVLGSLVFARLVRWPLGLLLGAGTLGIGVAYLGLAASHSLALACVAGIVGGVGNGLQWPSMISAVQKLTPGSLQGRLMGAAESLGSLCVAIGLPLGGLLVAVTNPRAAFVIVGAGALIATGALIRIGDAETSADPSDSDGSHPRTGVEDALRGTSEQFAHEHSPT
ncbi:MAG TPA: MFS transporter [Solirubrobacteraceae bacterium]